MFPITLEEIEESYAETGLKPIASEWGDAKTLACPMTAVVVNQCGKAVMLQALDEGDPDAAVGEILGLTPGVVSAFILGYDGCDAMDSYTTEETEAYEAGKQARCHLSGIPGEKG